MSILINSLRFWDEEDYPQGHICMYVYEILSILSSAHAWTSVILAGERDIAVVNLLRVLARMREQVIKCKKSYQFAIGRGLNLLYYK